jgi:Holliday junction resolvasome RuvABC DNA-binding subunit
MIPNPKKAEAAAKAAPDKNEPNPEAVETLKMFGFTEAQAKRGLRKCDNN